MVQTVKGRSSYVSFTYIAIIFGSLINDMVNLYKLFQGGFG